MQHTKKGYIIQHYGSMSIKSNSMATHWNIPVSLSTNMIQTNSSARPGLQGRDIPVNYQQHRVKLQWLGCWLEGRISCPGFFLLSIFSAAFTASISLVPGSESKPYLYCWPRPSWRLRGLTVRLSGCRWDVTWRLYDSPPIMPPSM